MTTNFENEMEKTDREKYGSRGLPLRFQGGDYSVPEEGPEYFDGSYPLSDESMVHKRKWTERANTMTPGDRAGFNTARRLRWLVRYEALKSVQPWAAQVRAAYPDLGAWNPTIRFLKSMGRGRGQSWEIGLPDGSTVYVEL